MPPSDAERLCAGSGADNPFTALYVASVHVRERLHTRSSVHANARQCAAVRHGCCRQPSRRPIASAADREWRLPQPLARAPIRVRFNSLASTGPRHPAHRTLDVPVVAALLKFKLSFLPGSGTKVCLLIVTRCHYISSMLWMAVPHPSSPRRPEGVGWLRDNRVDFATGWQAMLPAEPSIVDRSELGVDPTCVEPSTLASERARGWCRNVRSPIRRPDAPPSQLVTKRGQPHPIPRAPPVAPAVYLVPGERSRGTRRGIKSTSVLQRYAPVIGDRCVMD